MGESGVLPRFHILGPLRVLGPDHVALPLGGRRPRELLALLLLHVNSQLSTERIVDALWGESASPGASVTLRTHVAAVRKVLAAAGAGNALATRPGGYALLLDPADVDAEVFERQAERGQEALALRDPGRAAALTAQALALWDGEPLADLGPPDFATTTIARLQELRLVAEETSLTAELELGRHRELVPRLHDLVALHPYRERLVAHLMLALYRSGRQAEALTTYAETRRLLADELGLDPGPELQELETAMLRQDPLLLADADVEVAGGARNQPTTGTGPRDAVLAALRRTPMVGRERELLALEQRWRSVVAGESATALVSGPAGIGKSRLVAELADLAADTGAAVLVARCDDASVPYQPLAATFRSTAEVTEALRQAPDPVRERLAPLVSDGVDADVRPTGPAVRAAFLNALEWLVSALAAERPLLLVVEEAERLDAATASVLRHLARRPPGRSMLVIAYRDPPGSRHRPLLELVGDGGVGQLADRVPLSPLTVDDLTGLVTALAEVEGPERLATSLWERTGGNPFFATEVLRDLGTVDARGTARPDLPLPTSVRDVLRHRLETLPDSTREVIGAASVLGGEVELLLLGQVVGRPEELVVETLEPAVARGFLVESGRSWAGGYAFPHDLMREAVYAELPAPVRERLHRRAAEALTLSRAPADADVIAAAVHLRAAAGLADPREVADASLRASAVAARSLAWAEAVHHGEAALPFLDRVAPGDEQAAARVRLALLRLRSGHDYSRAIALLDEALRRQLDDGDLEAAGTTHSRIGGALGLHHSVMDVPGALQHLDDAERLLPDPDRAFHLHRGRMQAAIFGLRLEVLEHAVDRAEEVARRSGRSDLAAYAAWGAGYLAANRGRPGQARHHLERAWQAAHARQDPYLSWPPAAAAAHVAAELFLDPATGRSWCRRGLGQARFASFADPHEAVADQLARTMAAMGDLGDALRAAQGLPSDALTHRVLAFHAGRWEEAARRAEEALASDEAAGNVHDALFNARRLAESWEVLGEPERAAGVLEQALDLALSGPQVPTEVWLRARLAQLAPATGGPHLQRCQEVVTDEDWAGLRGEVALARGVVDGWHERHREAESALDEATAVFAAYRLPWRQAEAHLARARLLDERGLDGRAGEQRARARALYRRIGATERWVLRCDASGEVSTRSQRPTSTVGP